MLLQQIINWLVGSFVDFEVRSDYKQLLCSVLLHNILHLHVTAF